MNILCVVTDAFGSAGGIAQAARDIINGFATLPRLRQIVVVPRYGPALPGGAPMRAVQISGCPNRLFFAFRAAYHAVRTRPALIFCNHLHLAPLACLLALAINAKLIVQLHGIEIWEKPTPLRRWSLEHASLLLCVSRDTRHRLIGFCDIISERVFVLGNTVDARFHPGDRLAARKRFAIGAQQLMVLTVSRLARDDRYKGQDRVISVLSEMRRSGLDIVYIIAGTGDDVDHMRDLAEEHGVADSVIFLGYVADEFLPDLYRAADLFALPSLGEGFGIAYLEAMACGTPAIGLNVGGAKDALVDGELGICPDPQDFDIALQKALAGKRPDPHHLTQAVSDHFGFPVFARRLKGILARIGIPTGYGVNKMGAASR